MNIEEARAAAEQKAWDCLARYKYWMFGYWAAQWVTLNRLCPKREANPFTETVQVARKHSQPNARRIA